MNNLPQQNPFLAQKRQLADRDCKLSGDLFTKITECGGKIISRSFFYSEFKLYEGKKSTK